MNASFSLYRLQTLDTKRLQIHRRLKAIMTLLDADEEVRAAHEAHDQALAAHKEAKRALDDLTDQHTQKKLKLELTQSQLFGGKVRSPKELQDLQAESEALKRTMAALDESQLHAMDALEGAQADMTEKKEAWQALVNQKASQNSQLLAEKTKLDEELPRVEKQRAAEAALLDSELLRQYEALFRAKGGRAVAKVQDDGCQACGSELTPSELQAARSPSTLARCKNCGRILYLA